MHGKSEIARDRLRQPSTNQIDGLTRATPATYQSYLPDGRNHPAYIAHRKRKRTHEHINTHSALQLMRRWTFDIDRELTHDRPASYWARPVSIDDGLEVIMWIRCLGDERLLAAFYALPPNLKKGLFLPSERDRFFLSFAFYTSVPKCVRIR